MFCKVEDSNKNLYILTDKYKQPLIAMPHKNTKTCFIPNGKKFLDNPELINGNGDNFGDLWENSFFNDTKIPYTKKDDDSDAIVNKSDIDFNIYDIATIKKNKIFIDEYNKKYSEKDIENYFIILFSIDKDNKDYTEKMSVYGGDLLRKGEKIPLNVISSHITKIYDYYQGFLIKEDITKVTSPTKLIDDNNLYIGIFVLFILFIFAIAFGYWVFKPNQQYPNY